MAHSVKIMLGALLGLAACLPVAQDRPAAQLSEAEVINSPGELSAIEITDGGAGFVALSDRGYLLFGTLTRDGSGQLSGAQVDRHLALTGDSEGLALRGGMLSVSYERDPARITQHDLSGRTQGSVPMGGAFAGLPVNKGLEALAIDPQGRLYAAPEQLFDGTIQIWRLGRGGWEQAFALPSPGGLRAVGMDFGPDGRLYLLERRWLGTAFTSRVRVMDANGAHPQVVLSFPAGRHGNLEGISVWRDAAGRLRLTMVEDNNQLGVQRGGMVEYVLP